MGQMVGTHRSTSTEVLDKRPERWLHPASHTPGAFAPGAISNGVERCHSAAAGRRFFRLRQSGLRGCRRHRLYGRVGAARSLPIPTATCYEALLGRPRRLPLPWCRARSCTPVTTT